jgi:hypothetical protein
VLWWLRSTPGYRALISSFVLERDDQATSQARGEGKPSGPGISELVRGKGGRKQGKAEEEGT